MSSAAVACNNYYVAYIISNTFRVKVIKLLQKLRSLLSSWILGGFNCICYHKFL